MFSRNNQTDANPAVATGDHNSFSYGAGSGNTESGRGPHKSSLLNKLDPRVSTNTQHTAGNARNDVGALGTSPRQEDSSYGNTVNSGYHTNNTGQSGDAHYGDRHTGHGSGGTDPNTGSANAGPHKWNLANKIDPRVDSRDNDPRSPDSGYTTQHKSGYNNPTSNTGYDTSNTTSPPYTSKFSTKGNPPVDSDGSKGNYANYDNSTGNYSSLTGKYGSKLSGTAQSNTAPTTTGPHRSDWANKVDPRVDSDDSRGRYGNTTGAYNNSNAGTNYGTNQGDSETARPHKSDLLNKLDPRIDSDKGGSRNDGVGQGMGQGVGSSNTAVIPQDISSHGHATGAPASALEGKHGKHISGNVANATASASVSGGMNPEGSANASGPTSADAGTTTSYQGGLRGAIRDMVPGNNTFDNQREGGQQQGEYVPRHRNY